MKIPIGSNYLTVYKQYKEHGIKITSHFTGVVFNLNSGKPTWMARCQVKGKWCFLGRFEFSFEGEKKAADVYISYLKTQDLKPRYKAKRKYSFKELT